jgi:hypothetical protein
MSIVNLPSEGSIGASRKPKRFDIEVYQGDTFPFYLTFSGASLNVTGWTATATVKKVDDGTVVNGIITIGAVDTTNKRFLIDLDSETLLPDTEYMYDVQVIDASANKRTFIGGIITVIEDITE